MIRRINNRQANQKVCRKLTAALNAFTLLETLFVVLLTAIVISLVFVYFNTFQRYMHGQNKILEYELNIMRFESLLKYDLDRAHILTFDRGILELEGIDVNYEFNEEFLVRQQYENIDSLVANRIEWEIYTDDKLEDVITGIEIIISDTKDRRREYLFAKQTDIKTKFEVYKKQNLTKN